MKNMQILQRRRIQVLLNQSTYDIGYINIYCNEIRRMNVFDLRTKTILKIYDCYLYPEVNISHKHAALRLLQYLMTISVNEFIMKFKINDESNIQMIVKLISDKNIKTQDELEIKALIA